MKYISLGEICMPAYYLRDAGLRAEAYPFDWCMSGPRIVLDCLQDGFASFLDPAQIRPAAEGTGSEHRKYHNNLFRHREAHTVEGIAYYQRAVDRFRNALAGVDPVTVVACFGDPFLHKPWYEGFKPGWRAVNPEEDWSKVWNRIRGMRPGIKIVTIELRRSTTNRSDWRLIAKHDAPVDTVLFIQGVGGAPFEHPDDVAVTKKLIHHIGLL